MFVRGNLKSRWFGRVELWDAFVVQKWGTTVNNALPVKRQQPGIWRIGSTLLAFQSCCSS